MAEYYGMRAAFFLDWWAAMWYPRCEVRSKGPNWNIPTVTVESNLHLQMIAGVLKGGSLTVFLIGHFFQSVLFHRVTSVHQKNPPPSLILTCLFSPSFTKNVDGAGYLTWLSLYNLQSVAWENQPQRHLSLLHTILCIFLELLVVLFHLVFKKYKLIHLNTFKGE